MAVEDAHIVYMWYTRFRVFVHAKWSESSSCFLLFQDGLYSFFDCISICHVRVKYVILKFEFHTRDVLTYFWSEFALASQWYFQSKETYLIRILILKPRCEIERLQLPVIFAHLFLSHVNSRWHGHITQHQRLKIWWPLYKLFRPL